MLSETIPSDRLEALLAGIDPQVLGNVMPLTGGVITMMFTDIVDSSRIKASMGDEAFFAILEAHNALVRRCLPACNGRELKTMGDAFLLGFALPGAAIDCAVQIQQALRDQAMQTSQGPLRVRIGLHTGTPIVYKDPVSQRIDLSGTDVDRAARVESLACGGQILISEETRLLAKPSDVLDWGLWELKGLGRHRVYEVLYPGKSPERPAGRAWLPSMRFLTRFVGREAELAQVTAALDEHRLVTLRGLGGMGKTRLADEVAARLSQGFDDGVWVVELAHIANSEPAVAAALVERLGAQTAGFPDEAAALSAGLRNWRALVLDNCEAVPAAAPLVGRLLRECPGLRLLATSQQLLGLMGEQQIEVQPMASPPEGAAQATLGRLDSYLLFRDRAQKQFPGWEPAEGQTALVAEILRLTDGIPLAIELAAAWVDRVALPELRDGLQRRRLEYLARSGPGIEEQRHASLAACIDWAFGLLESPDQRNLFAQLWVFAGGLFAEDVAALCRSNQPAAALEALRSRSLLAWEESLGRTRYRLLPTVRDYAGSKLTPAQREDLRRRHAGHFFAVLGTADDQVRGKEQMAGLARIGADLENVQSGMETAMETGDHRLVVRFAAAFGTYLSMKGRFSELLERSGQDWTPLRLWGTQSRWP